MSSDFPLWLLGAVLFAAALVAGCGEPTLPEGTVARVDGAALTEADVQRTYVDALLRTGRNDTERHRRQHVERLIDGYLLAAEARRRGLDSTDAFQTYAALERAQGLAAAYFDHALLQTLPPLDDDALRRAYARAQRQPVVRHARYATEAEAQAAYTRLQAGAPLVTLAQEAFGQPGDSLAGVLGPVSYFSVDDAFAEVAFALDVGDVSPPVQTRYGWHLVGVEDVRRNPLPTESGYERRREGLASRLSLRTRRLEGDRFVRGEMEALGVEVRPGAIRALADAVADLTPVPAPDAGPQALRVRDVRAVEAALAPETVLVTYTEAGATKTFTAADFVRWLPVLPYAELRHRPAAAVGRALRNEVFARRAEHEGLADDLILQADLARAERLYLADLLRASLAEAAPLAPDAPFVRQAVERMEERLPRTTTATFWIVPFGDAEAAQEARTAVEGGADPQAYAGFERFEDAALADLPPWRTLVAQAPPGQPVVAGDATDGWYLLHVAARTTDAPALSPEQRAAVEARASRGVPEYDLLRRLRAERPLDVDSARLRQLVVPE